jgi:putative ABC transport system permease protein
MSLLASWLTALRIARREARRARGRSTLVVAMIALPVLFLSFTAVTYDMLTLTGAEKADRRMGTADARIEWSGRGRVLQVADPDEGFYRIGAGLEADTTGPPTQADLIAALPAGTRVLPLLRTSASVRTVGGIGSVDTIVLDTTDPLARGYVTVRAGRTPSAAGEVALTRQAMQRTGVGLGGTLLSADRARSFTVVGEVEFPSSLAEFALFAPEAATVWSELPATGSEWLVDTPTPVSWSDVRRLNGSGMAVSSRQVLMNPPPDEELPVELTGPAGATDELAIATLVAGLALLEIVLLAGPAFAVGARRRQRQLALVAATGGTPAHVRRIVLADGVVLGAVGAVVGTAGGVAAALIGRPYVEELLAHQRAGGYRVFPVALAVIAALAVVTGVLAALVPAFTVARQSVVMALAGRRGVTRSRKRWIALGVGLIAVGAAVTVAGALAARSPVMLAGLVLGELGLVFCTPAVVGFVARAGRALPLTGRIALRDAARNRAAAAPAISAVMAAVAGSIAIGLYLDSERTLQHDAYQLQAPVGTVVVYPEVPGASSAQMTGIESTLRSTGPIGEVTRIGQITCPPGASPDAWCGMRGVPVPRLVCPYEQIAGERMLTADEARAARADSRCDDASLTEFVFVDDGSGLAALTGATGDDLARAQGVLRAGGVVVSNPSLVENGTVTLNVLQTAAADAKGRAEKIRVTPMTLPAHLLTTGVDNVMGIASPEAVRRAGLSTVDGVTLASTTRMPTQVEEDRMVIQLQALHAYPYVERGAPTESDARLLVLMATATAITLGAAGVGTGLAAADRRPDLSTLAAVGASPRLRRFMAVSQSGVIAGLGSVLGTVAGVGAAVAIIVALNQSHVAMWPGPDLLPIVVPWLSLGVALIAAPVLAMLGAGLLTRSRLPVERRQ